MPERFYAAVYWGPREESLDECTDRTVRWFEAIGQVDPLFANWFHKGYSRKEAMTRPFSPGREAIRDLLDRGRHYTDFDPKVMPDLGFDFGLWADAGDDEAASLSVGCGMYSPYVSNVCLLEPPGAGPAAERLVQVDVFRQLLSAAVRCWEPDHGLVVSHQCLDKLNLGDQDFDVGWLTYLSNKFREVPPLPSPSYTEPIDNLGQLIVATNELFSSEREDHINILRGIASALGLRTSDDG